MPGYPVPVRPWRRQVPSLLKEADRAQGARYDRALIVGRSASERHVKANLLQGRCNDMSWIEWIDVSVGASLGCAGKLVESRRDGFGPGCLRCRHVYSADHGSGRYGQRNSRPRSAHDFKGHRRAIGGDAPKLDDLRTRGQADIEVKGTRVSAMIGAVSWRKRDPMSHSGNDVSLDHIRAGVILPDTPGVPSHLLHKIGFGGADHGHCSTAGRSPPHFSD
jgi:hypothetical protein